MNKLFLLTLLTFAAHAAMQGKNVIEVISSNKDLSTLASLINKAELADTLRNLTQVTILAPVNSAFDKIDPKTLSALTVTDIQNILKHHVIIGSALANQVTKLQTLKPLGGKAINVTVRNGSVFFDDKAEVIKADIPATNGIVHLIDTVILS